MLYEIHNTTGAPYQMTLLDATDPAAEVAKWSDAMRATVTKIVNVDSFPPPEPIAPADPITFRVPDEPTAPEIKEAIFGLAETISMTRTEVSADRDGQNARIAALEAEIAALKGVVR